MNLHMSRPKSLATRELCRDVDQHLSLEIYFFGWMTAFVTLGIQIGILAFFVMASEAKLQEDTIDIQFTWKCPRDSDVCDDKADLTKAGWIIFSLLMIAFLAKDIINGCKLIYFSSKVGTLGARIRYFIAGMGLFSITLFAFYVSCCYRYHMTSVFHPHRSCI